MAGYSDADIAADENAWRERIHQEDRAQVEEDIRAYLDGRSASYYNEHRVICRDGTVKWVLARGMIVSRSANGQARRMIGTHADITRRREMEERMHHMAHFDPLTDLPNRRLFFDRLGQAMALGRRDGSSGVLMFLDLDHFKEVNDQLGHGAGDTVLIGVATRLREQVRQSDTVARLGGDEFTVILPSLHDRHDAVRVANNILAAIGKPFDIGGKPVRIGITIGIALFPQHGDTVEQVLKAADDAMYRAKDAGRNCYAFASAEAAPSVNAAAIDRKYVP